MKMVDLLREAQFHGSNRLAEKYCRPLWLVVLSLLLLAATCTVNNNIVRNSNNPTYITRIPSHQTTTVFPSVLLCPEIMFPQSKREKFISTLNIPGGVNETYLKNILSQLAAFYAPDFFYELDDLLLIERVLKYNNIDEEDAAKQMTPSCEEFLIKCRWRDRMVNCSEIFLLELTEFGFCCVFNGRSLRRERRELSENNKKIEYPKPWRTSRVGYTSGLMFVVNQSDVHPFNLDIQYKWLILQAGQHYVDSTSNGSAISSGKEILASYSTQSYRVSPYTRSLSDEQRRCKLFEDRLKYFPNYNRLYCLLECQMEQTWQKCECIPMAHPQTGHLPRCNASKVLCTRQSGVSLEMGNCQCPQACEFGTEEITFQNQELKEGAYPYDTFYDGLDLAKVTVVRVYIQKHEFMLKYRVSYFNYTDSFAQLGGMFNVFFGCSVLTLIEIVQLFCYGVRERLLKRRGKINPQLQKK